MKPSDNDKIKETLSKTGRSFKPKVDYEKWCRENPQAVNALKMRAEKRKMHKDIKFWRIIMRSRISKLAAATVILVGVLLLTSVFVKTNKSIVLAGVLDRIEKVQAYMYSIHITATESTNQKKPPIKQHINTTIIFSNEYGMKSEMDIKWDTGNELNPGISTTQQMYVLPDRKLSILLKPESKKYKLMELNDESIARMKEENKDPRVMMNRIMACEYTQLGRTVLDGIEVEGFETTDSKIATDMVENCEDVRVILWVDVEAWLPVLWEMDMTINEYMQVHCIISDFQWNIPVAASDFEPVIPEDYTPMEHNVIPSSFEEEALKGFHFFAEIFGHYPEKIDQRSLAQELSSFRTRENLTDNGLKLREEIKLLDPEQSAKKYMDMSQSIQSIGTFYKILVISDKEPVYYGETMGPDNVDAVLLKWKVSDNEYRIIFGDLSIGNTTTEELVNVK